MNKVRRQIHVRSLLLVIDYPNGLRRVLHETARHYVPLELAEVNADLRKRRESTKEYGLACSGVGILSAALDTGREVPHPYDVGPQAPRTGRASRG